VFETLWKTFFPQVFSIGLVKVTEGPYSRITISNTHIIMGYNAISAMFLGYLIIHPASTTLKKFQYRGFFSGGIFLLFVQALFVQALFLISFAGCCCFPSTIFLMGSPLGSDFLHLFSYPALIFHHYEAISFFYDPSKVFLYMGDFLSLKADFYSLWRPVFFATQNNNNAPKNP